MFQSIEEPKYVTAAKQYQREYYLAHRQKKIEYQRKYHQENKGKKNKSYANSIWSENPYMLHLR